MIGKESRLSRARWWIPLTAVGLALFFAGRTLDSLSSGPHALCHIFSDIKGIAAASFPQSDGASLRTPSCTSVDVPYFAALATTGLGLVGGALGGYGVLLAAQRRRAWVSARRPVVFVAAVLAMLPVWAGVDQARASWDDAQNRAALHRAESAYANTVRTLPDLVLPNGIIRSPHELGCAVGAATVCAHTELTPERVEPLLVDLLHGRTDAASCNLLRPPSGGACPVRGQIAGYPAIAFASPDLVLLHNGQLPPPGARPWKPGSKRVFVVGAVVTISLVDPEAVASA